MKKSLFVLSLLAAASAQTMAQTAPSSSINLYGLLDFGIGQTTKNGPPAGAPAGTPDNSKIGFQSGFNSATKVGAKGTLALGSGLAANFNLETSGLGSDGDIPSPLFGRAAWVGLSGGFGETRFGPKVISLAIQTTGNFDLNGTSTSSAYDLAGIAPIVANNLGTRRDRHLQYVSPSLGGAQLLVGYTFAKQEVGAKAIPSVGLNYTAGPITVAATVEKASGVVSGNSDANKAPYSLGASYDLGVAKVSATYAANTQNTDFNERNKGFGIGVVAPIAGLNVGLQVAKNSATSVTGVELFVNKEVFKNTLAYFDYGQKSASKADLLGVKTLSDRVFNVGVIYTF